MSYRDELFQKIEDQLELAGEAVINEEEWQSLFRTLKHHVTTIDALQAMVRRFGGYTYSRENVDTVAQAEKALAHFYPEYNQKR